MKVLFLMTLNSGTSYWRIFNPAKHIERNNGCRATLFPDYDPSFGNVYLWEQQLLYDSEKGTYIGTMIKDWADIIVGQRFFTDAGLAVIDVAHRFKKKFFTEIDDYIFEIPGDHPSYEVAKPGSMPLKVQKEQMKISDGLIVSTKYLKKLYREFNKNIYIIPNAIDFKLWKSKPSKNRKIVNIGYVGGAQHFRDIKLLRRPVEILLKKYKHIRFKIWGGRAEIVPSGPRVINIQSWTPTLNYPRELAKLNFDIGLAPLVDNYLNRAKSALRWLEYSAMGIPTIASPITPFKEVSPIYLAKSTDDWVDMISHLVESRENRERLGQAAREKVFQFHNIEKIANEYIAVLRKEITN